jgi:hypothetical protein
MKKLIITILLATAGSFFSMPGKTQGTDMDNLQKQVTSLKNSNAKLENRFKQFIKTTTSIKDSLQTGLNASDTKLKALSDSLMAKEAQLKAIKTDLENSKADIHSIASSNTIQYIFFVVLLIIILVVYFLLAKKASSIDEESQERLAKAKEEIGLHAGKTSDMLKSEMVEIKDDLQKKISEVEKKLSAAKVKD